MSEFPFSGQPSKAWQGKAGQSKAAYRPPTNANYMYRLNPIKFKAS